MELYYNDENWRLADIQWKWLSVFSFQSKSSVTLYDCIIYIYIIHWYHRTIPTTCASLNILWSCARGQRGDPTLGFFQTYLRLTVQWSRARGQTDRQMNQDYPFFQSSAESSMKSCEMTEWQTDEWRLPFFPVLTWKFSEVAQEDRQTDWQTDRWMKTTLIPDLPESSMKLCRMADRQTDRWTKSTLFPVLTWEFNEIVQEDRQTDRWTKTILFPVVTWEFTEVVQDRQTNRQMNQDFYFSSGYLRVQWSCAGGQTDRWSRTVPLPVHWPQTECWWRWCKTQPACPCTHSTAHLQHKHQGMTIRTARLPGAGNLLGQAGEDLSGLPDQESRYQVIFYWQYISIQALDFESLWQFLFHGSTIATSVSFYIIKPTDFSVVACDWLASAVKPIRS